MALGELPTTEDPTSARCYNCGGVESLGRKNIPPASFFPEELRKDLLLVDSCSKCRSAVAVEDAAMRLWLSSLDHASEEGKMIYSQYALPLLFEKPENFKTLATIQPGDLLVAKRYGFLEPSRGFQIPQHCAVPFIRRLTMGMLSVFYPGYDYYGDTFISAYREVKMWAIDDLREHMDVLTAFSIHAGIFRMWHGLSDSDDVSGMWIYVFYNCAAFVCIHGPAGQIQAAFPTGHEGWKNLF